MKFPGLKLNEIGRNRGGELRFVALLCLATSLALSVLLLTDSYFGRHDTLSRFVPAQAAIYLHANRGQQMTSWATQMLALPENIEADETARFALVNGDGSLSWGALFRWRAWQRPTPAERELLDRAEATPIDDRTFLICDDRVAAAVLDAWGNGRAISNYRDTSRALALARSLADLQAYADPEQLPRDADASGLYLFQDLKAFTLAAATSDGRVRLTVAAANAAIPVPAWLGGAADVRTISRPGPELPSGADLAVYGTERGVDFRRIMFGGIDAEASASPLADPAFAQPARSDLDSLMNEFDAAAFYGSNRGRPGFYAVCSGCEIDRVAGRISEYANAAVPERRLVELPDKDTLTELVYSDQTARWKELGTGEVRSLSINGNEIGLYLTSRDSGSNGRVVLTNEPRLLASATNEKELESGDSCSLQGTRRAVIKPEIGEKMIKALLGDHNFTLNGAKNVVVVQNESGLLISCGYIGGNVDK